MVDSFRDCYGKTWKLVKRSTDNSVEIPDPQYLQVTDYWCHKANVYSSDLMDSKISKLYALCKTQQTTDTTQIEQQNVQQEHIEDINLDAVLKQ